MPLSAVLLPLFAQVFLTFALLLFRGAPSFSQKIEPGNRAPSGLLQFGGSTQNGFELPFMFYLLVLLVILAKKDDFAFVVMEWAFVALRFINGFLQTRYPPGRHPLHFHIAGLVVLFSMWAVFAYKVLMAATI
jgi:hypothetical protein